jgi:O-antigen/teichoic acid export membrane protein
MKVERRLIGNVAVLGAGEFVAQLANFLFVIIIARAFGPELLGHYSLSMAVTAIVVVFVSFGTIQLHVRNIGRNANEGGELLRTLFPVQVGLAIVAWIAVVSAGALSRLSATEVGLLAAIAGYQILVRMTGVLLTEPKGRQRMNPVAVVHAGTPILILCVASVLLWMNSGPLATLSVMPVCAFIFAIYAARTAIRLGGPLRPRWDPGAFMAGLKQARPFFAIMLLTSAYERLGVIILGVFASRVIVGEFAAGERIVAALGVLVSVVTTAALPALSSLAANDKLRLIQVGGRLIRVAWLVSLPVATVISLFSAEIINLVFGEAYAGASAVLAIAAILLVIRAIRAVLAPMAMATGRPGDLALARATALVALVCGAPFLITWYGAKGLAGTMVLSETILLTVLSSRLAAAGYLPGLLRPALGVLGACGVAYAVGLLGTGWPLLTRITATLAVGLFCLWVFRAIRTSDIQFFIDIARKKKRSGASAE